MANGFVIPGEEEEGGYGMPHQDAALTEFAGEAQTLLRDGRPVTAIAQCHHPAVCSELRSASLLQHLFR